MLPPFLAGCRLYFLCENVLDGVVGPRPNNFLMSEVYSGGVYDINALTRLYSFLVFVLLPCITKYVTRFTIVVIDPDNARRKHCPMAYGAPSHEA